jgi:hypothetical protein
MAEEGKELRAEVYTEDKNVLRTAERCKPYCPKRMESYFCCGVTDRTSPVKG